MIVNLNNRSLIKVFGEDSERFLQSQFSNDVSKLSANQVQINAYCQHQGKILSIIWLFKKNDNYYLSLTRDLSDLVLQKLMMYKMMSSVEIEDVSNRVHQYGLISENKDNCFHICNNLSLYTTRDVLSHTVDASIWEFACIENQLPEIYLTTSEKFVPQVLNLDLDEFGVSFTKGCYPGQEVVARMHYLGNPKRRLFHFVSDFEALIGDSIDVEDTTSLKSSGIVIRVTKIEEKFHLLGTFEIKHIQDSIYLNNDMTQPLKIFNE